MSRDYDAHREDAARRSREKSREGREIGPPPAVADPARRDACRYDLRLFCETYFPERFAIPWSKDHLRVIAKLQRAALEGGQFAVAMPRGSGKTTLCEVAALWVLLYGHRRFVVLIGATEGAADDNLQSIKMEIELNDLLYEDFPSVCYPVRMLEGIALRAKGQTSDGERTRIGWTGSELVLPTVAGSPSSGAVVRVVGITGRVRGMKASTPDGRIIRPDFVLIDDPQTDDSAKSPKQNADRQAVLTGAILGLGGPGVKISAVMPCTVIYPADMIDRILDRDLFPEWNGERTQLMYSMPAREDLWEKYREVRSEGLRAEDGGKAGTEFYRANREEMDRGAEPAWLERYNPDELSAVQNAMNLYLFKPAAFAAEYQNKPLSVNGSGELVQLEPDHVAKRINGRSRGEVPRECSRLTAGIDIQGEILYWVVCAWDDSFGGALIDYGAHPKQNRGYFVAADARPSLSTTYPGLGEEARIYAGLKHLTTELLSGGYVQHETGQRFVIERCLIDSGWQTSLVHKFVRASPFSALLLPSKGKGLKAAEKPMSEWQKRPGDRVGQDWRINAATRGQGRFVLFEANIWKSLVAGRLLSPEGAPGAFFLNGVKEYEHQLLADHLSSEHRVATEGRGRKVEEWDLRPGQTENHWFDCLVMAAVAAGVAGLEWSPAKHAGDAEPENRKSKKKLSEIQKRKMAG